MHISSKIQGGIVLLSTFFLFGATTPLTSQISGGDYTIYADSFGFAENTSVSGGDVTLYHTGGEFGVASSTGGTFVLRPGYQALERGTISFSSKNGENAVAFGQALDSAVSASSLVFSVTSESLSGYTVTVTEDGNLRDGENDIDDVVDGEVTAGSEEYGIRTVGGDGDLVADTAITNNLVVISNDNPVENRETTVEFRVAIDNDVTVEGDYAHTITFTATANP
ncbi:MAG: hypothetical protein CL685_00635 [Candidatus Magasanikbacteria bacterium]|nr:hypothetical protein [Candidatus Magasanikbacteria bacterium]